MEQAGLQQVDALKTSVHLQAIQAIGGDGVTVQVIAQFKTVAQVVEQAPFESAQQRFQGTAFGEGKQGGGVVIEDRRVRVFGGEQADQQFVEVEAAEQRFAIEPGGGADAFQAADVFQFTLATKLHVQRHEWPRLRAGLTPRAAQDSAKAALGREEVHQRTGLAVGATVQDVGRLAEGLGHGVSILKTT